MNEFEIYQISDDDVIYDLIGPKDMILRLLNDKYIKENPGKRTSFGFVEWLCRHHGFHHPTVSEYRYKHGKTSGT